MEEGEIEDGEIEDDSCDTTVVDNNKKNVRTVDLVGSNVGLLGSGVSGGKVSTASSSRQAGTADRKDNKSLGLGLDSNRPTRNRPHYGNGYAKRSQQKPAHRTDNYRNEKQYDNNVRNNQQQTKNKIKKRPHHDNDKKDLVFRVDEVGSTFFEKKHINDRPTRRKDESRRVSKNEASFKKFKKVETSLSKSRERNGDGQFLNQIPQKPTASHSKARAPDDFEQLLKEYQMVSEAIVREKEKIKQTEKEVNEEDLSSQKLSKSTPGGGHDGETKRETKTSKTQVLPEQILTMDKEENDDDDELLELRLAALTSLAQKDEKENKSKLKQESLPRKSETLSSNHSTKKRSATPRKSSAISRGRNRRRSLRQSSLKSRSRSRSTSGPQLRTTKDILNIDDEEERINQFLLYLRETPEARDASQNITKKVKTEADDTDKPGQDKGSATLGDDNYEEVEMDIDEFQEFEEKPELLISTVEESATGASSPATTAEEELPPIPGVHPIIYTPPPLPMESNLPKPPPPEPEPDEEDEDEEEILALRQLLLMNMKQKQKIKATDIKAIEDSKVSQSSSPVRTPGSESPNTRRPSKKKPTDISIPVHKEVVINLNDDSDSSDEEHNTGEGVAPVGYNNMLDQFLKEARKKADANKPVTSREIMSPLVPKTPEAMKQLSSTQQAEYKRLKEEIIKREKSKKLKGVASMNQSPVQSDLDNQSQDEGEKIVKKLTVTFAPKGEGERKVGMKEVLAQAPINDDSNATEKQKIAKKDLEKIAAEEKKKVAEKKEKKTTEEKKKKTAEEKEKKTAEEKEKKAAEEKEHLRQKKIKMVEEKLTKFRSAIEKDENLFEETDQRLEKKKSTFKLAMVKITKLTEQLDTVQRIANANKNSIIKIQDEQKELCSRLTQLKSRESRLLEALAEMKGVTLETIIRSHGAVTRSKVNLVMAKKRAAPGTAQNSNEPIKRQRLGSQKESVLAKERRELNRLQELEKMYAEKLAKFKESHKQLRLRRRLVASPAVSKVLKEANLSENIRPSKQLYLKDKITVPSSSGMNEDGERSAELKVTRRRSWLDEETSTMKPSLPSSSSAKDLQTNKSGVKDLPVKTSCKKDSSVTKSCEKSTGKSAPTKTETIKKDRIFDSKVLERLKKVQERREKVLMYFDWTASIEANVSRGDAPDVPGGAPELPGDIKVDLISKKNAPNETYAKATSLETYESPLMPWNIFRFNPLFKQLSSESQGSETFCNKINPSAIFCRFDLNGRCNDDDCKWQHARDCKMSFEETLAHLVSYNVSIVGATDKSTLQQIQRKVWLFAKMKCQKLVIDSEEERQKMMEKVMHLVLSKPQRAPSQLEPRRWKVTQRNKKSLETEDEAFTDEDVKITTGTSKPVNLVDPDFVDEEDLRYFASDVGTGQLENAVLQKPDDVQLWLKLAYKQLSKPGGNMDKALHALSTGLDSNKHNPELWLHYLTLYSKRCTNHDDVMEMCNHAINYTNDYDVWHKTLSIANGIDSKDNLCKDLLKVLQEEQQASPTNRGSHRLLEIVLYRSHLYCLVSKPTAALEILKDCVYKSNGSLVIDLLNAVDKCIAWLSFIHLKCFKQLPPCLFDSNSAAPSRIVSKDLLICPWTKSSINGLDDIQEDLNNAIQCCHNNEQSAADNIQACMPLHKNLVEMYIAYDSPKQAVATCRALLKECPGVDELWILLLKTLRTCDFPDMGHVSLFESVVKEAVCSISRSAGIYLTSANDALKNGNVDYARSLLNQCATSYYSEDAKDYDAITLYCKLLNQPLPYIPNPPQYSDDVKEDLKIQKVDLWLCYALFLEIDSSIKTSAVEAYEIALYDLDVTKDVQRIWLGYLHFHLRTMCLSTNTIQNMQTWHELVNRCLMTSACRFPVPHNTSKSWVDYSFHNKVVNLYMATIKEEDKLDVFERLLSMMPKNTMLLLRVCQYAVLEERPQQAFIHCTTFVRDQPHCIQAWRVAIHLQLITKNFNQFLLFLVAHGSESDVEEMVSTSLKHGINLQEMAIKLLPNPT